MAELRSLGSKGATGATASVQVPQGSYRPTVLITGTFVATFDIECSADDANFVPAYGIGGAALVGLTGKGAYPIGSEAPFFRLNVTAHTSGTIEAAFTG